MHRGALPDAALRTAQLDWFFDCKDDVLLKSNSTIYPTKLVEDLGMFFRCCVRWAAHLALASSAFWCRHYGTQLSLTRSLASACLLPVCSAKSSGASQSCSYAATIAPCDSGSAVSAASLGDGVCVADMDCPEYLEDGGDCSQNMTLTLPFAVTGYFSRKDFISAIKSGATPA